MEKIVRCRLCDDLIYECGCSGEKDWYCPTSMKPQAGQKIVCKVEAYLEVSYEPECKISHYIADVGDAQPKCIVLKAWKPLDQVNKENIKKE